MIYKCDCGSRDIELNAIYELYHRGTCTKCGKGNYFLDEVSLKRYLNIEDDFKDDDMLISGCISAAYEYVKDYLSVDDLTFGDEIEGTKNNYKAMAIIMLATNMYENRQPIITGKLNSCIQSMLDMDRKWL